MTESPTQPQPQSDAVHISELVDCAKCGHSNAPDARHCDNCGESLVAATKAVETGRQRQGLLAKIFGGKG